MTLRRLHHRLAVGMGLAALAGLAGGAGFQPLPVALAAAALILALFWQPGPDADARLQRVFAVGAALLVVRAGWLLVYNPDDRLLPMVDLLLLLLVAEALKPLPRVNDIRMYVLSFALLLASTVYRPGLIFALSFVAYVGLSTLALMIGHLRRNADRHGVRDVAVGRRFLLATGALSAVTLTVSAILFLAFPRVSRGWMPGGRGFATTLAGFADEVALDAHGASIQSNPQIVLRVEFPDGRPPGLGSFHWRGRSYDRFDGVRWSRSPSLPASAPGPEWYRRHRGGPTVQQEIYAAFLDTRVLFGIHPILRVRAHTRIRPMMDEAGDYRFLGAAPPSYGVVSYLDGPTPDVLRAAGSERAPASSYYLQLPPMSARVFRLADSLTAPFGNRYDRVMAVERWLQGFDYTLELPATAREATLEHFLFQRRAGHCEYFSTAMVVLLRAAGIPARNVNGFLGGEWNAVGDYLAVTQNQAHSWVEVWFPDQGWVTFDPTPAGAEARTDQGLGWFWPGRFLFDGLQHRWSKWVLDYDLGDQLGLFSRTTAFIGGQRGRQGGREGDGTGAGLPAWLLWLLGGGGAIGVAWALLATRRGRRHPETRLYLRLRRAYARHGFSRAPTAAPLAFARELREAAAPGMEHAETVVERYLESRFGGREAGADTLGSMRAALGSARRQLRAAARP